MIFWCDRRVEGQIVKLTRKAHLAARSLLTSKPASRACRQVSALVELLFEVLLDAAKLFDRGANVGAVDDVHLDTLADVG